MFHWRRPLWFLKNAEEIKPLEDPEIKNVVKEISEKMSLKIHGVYIIIPKKPALNAVHVKFSGKLNYIYIIGFLKDFFPNRRNKGNFSSRNCTCKENTQ